ncbi:hypothetical protein [Domibacillus aminovorans]|nr:hypothetical protein [Domibacillus aminovorans]
MKGGWKLHEIDQMDIHFFFELMEEKEPGVRMATDAEIDAIF